MKNSYYIQLSNEVIPIDVTIEQYFNICEALYVIRNTEDNYLKLKIYNNYISKYVSVKYNEITINKI